MLDVETTDPQLVAFRQSQRDKEWSSRCLLASFAYLGIPNNFYDVGCGEGHLVQLARDIGVTFAYGVDLYVPVYLGEKLDLNHDTLFWGAEIVVCWELAEHLRPGRADALCDMLVESTKKYLLFTAATLGQGGSGHLNEQPHSYWVEKITARGLRLDHNLTNRLRGTFSQVAPTCPWYGENLLVFENVNNVQGQNANVKRNA